MDIRLIAEFMGLVAVVPQASTKPPQADVIVVDGTYSPEGCAVGLHQAYLAADADDVVVKESTLKVHSILALSGGRRVVVWKLPARHRVELWPDDKPDNSGVVFKAKVNQDPKKQRPGMWPFRRLASWKDYGWLANVSLASGHKVNADYLKDQDPDPTVKTPVANLVHLTAGKLYGGKPRSELLRDTAWQFKSPSESVSHQRALSDHAYLELRAARSVHVKITPFKGTGGEQVVLVPARGRKVKISFSNLPLALPSHSDHTTIDHFKAFYELLKTPTECEKRRVPTLSAQLASGNKLAPGGGMRTTSVGNSDCPPAGVDEP